MPEGSEGIATARALAPPPAGSLRHAVQLLPENPDFEPIELDLRRDEMTIEGIAVGVIRSGKSL